MKIDKRKLFIIICIAVIAIILIILAAATIGRKKKIEANDLPTKAFWRKIGDSVHVTLSKPENPDYEWKYDVTGLKKLSLKEKNKSRKQVFTVSTDEKAFIENISFRLCDKNDENNAIYKLVLFFETDKKGNLSFMEAKGEKIDEAAAGKIGDTEYRFYNDGPNLVLVLNENGETGNDWEVKGGGSGLTVTGPAREDNVVRVAFSKEQIMPSSPDEETEEEPDADAGKTSGTAEAGQGDTAYTTEVYCEKILKSITVNIKIDENGRVSLLSQNVTDYEIPEVVDESEKKVFVEKYGSVKLPSNARKISYTEKTMYASNEDDKGLTVPEISFFINGKEYEYVFSDELENVSAFVWKYSGDNVKKSETEVKGTKIKVTNLPDNSFVFTWTQGKTVNAVFAYETQESEAEKIIEELV